MNNSKIIPTFPEDSSSLDYTNERMFENYSFLNDL
jgi:hypothetical protein